MKRNLLVLAVIVVSLLAGTSYLFLQVSAAQQTTVAAKVADMQKDSVQPSISLNVYPLSTAAARPAKVEGYTPPHHEIPPSALRQEGGETCASATAIASLPYNATGYTCDNVNDYDEVCPYSGSTSPDVVYSYTPATDEVINIDLRGSSYDTKLYVYQDVCDNAHLVACNDDYYSDHTSAIFGLQIYSGHTYYIVVDGYGSSCGDYVISMELHQPCDVVCPPNGIPEGEPNCGENYVDNYNGGCNSTPYVFQNINCNTTICGTSGTYLYYGSNYRDTDWFRLVLTQPTTLTWSAVAEFPVLISIINGGTENCADYTILDSTTANPCDTAKLTFDVQAGVYWLWVGPSVFSGYPCGLEYVAKVESTVATTGACCNDLPPYDCQILTPVDCDTLPNHTFSGLGTNCGPPNPCLPTCVGELESEASSHGIIAAGKYVKIHFTDSTTIEAWNHGRIEYWDWKHKGGKVTVKWIEDSISFKGTIEDEAPYNSRFEFTFQDNYDTLQGYQIVVPISGVFSGSTDSAGTNFSYTETLSGSSYDPFVSWQDKIAVLGEFTIGPATGYPTTISINWATGSFSIDTYEYLYSENLKLYDTATGMDGPILMSVYSEGTFECYPLIIGDANGDGKINASDVVYLINYLFIAGPAPVPIEAGDANCDAKISASDVVYLINYLFIYGPPPGC